MRFFEQTRTDLDTFIKDMDRVHNEQMKNFYKSRFYKWRTKKDERRRSRKNS